jgi:hypothetical protein
MSLGVIDAGHSEGSSLLAAVATWRPAWPKVGRPDEDDDVVPHRLPFLVSARPLVFGAFRGCDEADRTPEEIRGGSTSASMMSWMVAVNRKGEYQRRGLGSSGLLCASRQRQKQGGGGQNQLVSHLNRFNSWIEPRSQR